VLLYDVTSTYFEGEAEGNPLARRGYSAITGPTASRSASPWWRPSTAFRWATKCSPATSTTARPCRPSSTPWKPATAWSAGCGSPIAAWPAPRTWHGCARPGGRYIIGAPKAELRKFAAELAEPSGWREIRQGIEVKLARWPDTAEMAILCRSAKRRSKEQAMHDKFSWRIEAALARLASRIEHSTKRLKTAQINRQIGRILQQNQRSAARFAITVQTADCPAGLRLHVDHDQAFDDWSALSEAPTCCAPTSPIGATSSCGRPTSSSPRPRPPSASTRISCACGRSGISARDRVLAHILVCFLAFVLWKTLEMWQQRAGLGNSPRTVLDELARIQSHDVILPTAMPGEIRLRCVAQPDPSQAALLLPPA
jgi:hypothetical protein